jgi:carbon monoxide dehydrogenase subunit G
MKPGDSGAAPRSDLTMPAAHATILCPGTVDEIAQLLRDLTFLAGAIPHVTHVERLSDTVANWTFVTKIGFVSRTSVFRGEVLPGDPSTVRFRAVAPEATVEGSVKLVPRAPAETELDIVLEMHGQGALRAIIDNLVQRQLPADVQSFAAALKRQLIERAHSAPS